MIWLQGGLSAVVWVLCGVMLARRSGRLRERLAALPRTIRAVGGAVLLIASVLVLAFGVMGLNALGGLTPNGMTPLGWIGITLLGAVFVVGQTFAMACQVSLIVDPVTPGDRPASTDTDAQGKTQ